MIYTSTSITLVPIKEMADVLSVESKSMDLSRDSWVRMKIGTYKGDLAKVDAEYICTALSFLSTVHPHNCMLTLFAFSGLLFEAIT